MVPVQLAPPTSVALKRVQTTAKGKLNRIDPYGFERRDDFEPYKEMMNEYVAVLNRRSKRWSKLLQDKPTVEKNITVKRYVRKGVPNEHRAKIWMAASGAQEQLEAKPGYYQSLLEMEHDAKLKETIHTDMHRTFPDNILFKSRAEEGLQKALYNVLLAYGHHNQTVGYCQGMNFIAGYLMIITKDEEQSFWLMDALLGRILQVFFTDPVICYFLDAFLMVYCIAATALFFREKVSVSTKNAD
ncbi:growth hormone-regulated TBC protein 1-A-like [Nematolebias whitei]|uniref:growth hormone-regulated TBC protein 1-A-like n=1 Tax=Nematolebias whitei TaxID=451745 RepID=UPI0018989531|nr:growth hormone-regulated TBC protein 1-A-like [Nematolebias whitei]